MIDYGELVGDLYKVPDSWWGFDKPGGHDHPGACVGYHEAGYKVIVLKGTDPRSADYKYAAVLVEPDASNNLSKRTSFAINAKRISAPRLGLLADEKIGVLAASDLPRMQDELNRQFLDRDGD